ncbi:type II CAAX prenyl endopeptidase Rce1 family protein [Oceanihabitans sediminis]
MIVLEIPIQLVFEYLDISDDKFGGFNPDDFGVFTLIFLSLILAPILETLVSQLIPIEVSQAFFKNSGNIIGITIATIIFSSMHLSYSIWYAIAVMPSGFLFAHTYIIFQKRKESSFWMASILHASINLIPLTIDLTDRFIK